MKAIIHTDASFDPKTKVAGYAFAIHSIYGNYRKAGPLKGVKTPQQAESKSILIALRNLLDKEWRPKKYDYGPIKYVVICTDSDSSISGILGKTSRNLHNKKIYEILEQNDITYEFQKVKSHKNSNSQKQKMNDWCDNKAKEEMRKQLQNQSGSF